MGDEKTSGAANSTTVDWTGWLDKTPAQQAATWAQYRAIIAREADANKLKWRQRPW